jgi:hypothetical protein
MAAQAHDSLAPEVLIGGCGTGLHLLEIQRWFLGARPPL